MLHQHHQFLPCDKALESTIKRFVCLNDYGHATVPLYLLCFGEQLLHQLILGTHTDFSYAIAQLMDVSQPCLCIDGSLSVTDTEELNIAIHGLASQAVHDDVDGGAQICSNNLRVLPKESKNFLLREAIGDLKNVSQHFIVRIRIQQQESHERWVLSRFPCFHLFLVVPRYSTRPEMCSLVGYFCQSYERGGIGERSSSC